jgi:acetylornithine deacetylase/succinyl-diaminopimelate desuccinylase-like protein
MFNPQRLYEYIAQQWQDNVLPSLCDYIRIPNKSPHFDPQWQENGHMEKAVSHIANWCKKNAPLGMTLEVLRLPKRTPLLFMVVPGQIEKTVLLYGHLDKQPEMEGWSAPLEPWEPILKNNCLYGRGSADDGYATYASLTAIRALQEQGLPHARCVLIIEACEESGSYDLPFYIDALKEKIGQPSLVICLDSGAGNYEQLWMTTSLRGNITGELSVEVLTEGVHSGAASGIVPDSFRIVRQLLSRIEDETTGEIKLKGLYCIIPEERQIQAKHSAEILGAEVYESFPFQPNMKPVTENKQELILNRTWRPALTITGATGLPPACNAGNVLRPKTSVKLSMRLPPLVAPPQAIAAMEETLTRNPPYKAKIKFQADHGSIGWNAPPMAKWLEDAVNDASMNFYRKPVAYMGEGGTIPFMGMLGEKFPQAQFVITGVLGPHSNAHGPNEFLHLEMVKKLTACIAFILNSHYQQAMLDR